jgi:hypothetical protein
MVDVEKKYVALAALAGIVSFFESSHSEIEASCLSVTFFFDSHKLNIDSSSASNLELAINI